MKIRTAIFGVYVAASAVGLAILMGFVLREVRLRYVESMRRTLNDTTAMLAVLLEADLARQAGAPDLGAAWRANLPAFARAAGALRVYVTDARGLVVFDGNDGRDIGRDYTLRPEMRAYFAKAYEAAENTGVVDGELRVTTPVKQGGAIVGFVGVARPFSTVTAAIFRARLRLAVGALAVAALMVAAGWWISSKLTHSLERLTDYALAVRDGRTATPPASRAKEIAALARAFEEMRVTLEEKAHVERYTQALAHEFKAPLSAIRGAAELLDEEMPREARARFVANLRAESERMRRIVDRLLELAALEARRGGGEFAEVGLRAVVEEVCATARNAAAQRNVTLTLAAGSSPRVHGEKFLLAQAVGNLVQNALEFVPSGGAVNVSLHEQSGRAIVTVDDDGPGVPEFARERVFERFYSLPRPDSGRKSSGLGLSIVREIARLHGGAATLENRAEGGARATLSLPVASDV
ncbi:MAG TPA: two-component system sensor histidine kinase CreC [Opitutaceae bacterium]|nr:two-component system sensor histidine kinase CreC [Opitutaceae bacterium]